MGHGHIAGESRVIRYDDVVALLVAACPGYDGSPEHESVDDGDGEYIRVAGFVTYLIRLLDEGETEIFARVFGVVEEILEDADPAAEDLTRAGFLDDLADSSLYEGRGVRPVHFAPWLGARARQDPSIRAVLIDDDR
jgi:hypothetical protein